MYVIRNRDKSHKGNNNAEKMQGDVTQIWGVRKASLGKQPFRWTLRDDQAEYRAQQAGAICWVRLKDEAAAEPL